MAAWGDIAFRVAMGIVIVFVLSFLLSATVLTWIAMFRAIAEVFA